MLLLLLTNTATTYTKKFALELTFLNILVATTIVDTNHLVFFTLSLSLSFSLFPIFLLLSLIIKYHTYHQVNNINIFIYKQSCTNIKFFWLLQLLSILFLAGGDHLADDESYLKVL